LHLPLGPATTRGGHSIKDEGRGGSSVGAR